MHVLITAGPTREYIDPVRFISNPSSGKMGYAIAQECLKKDFNVTIVCGPLAIKITKHPKLKLIDIVSAQEMYDTVKNLDLSTFQIAFFVSAVSDFRPISFSKNKIKKKDETVTLKLERTQDILASMRDKFNFQGLLIGFAAETENFEQNALKKLKNKKLDAIIANKINSENTPFASDFNEVLVYSNKFEKLHIKKTDKTIVAKKILDHILQTFF